MKYSLAPKMDNPLEMLPVDSQTGSDNLYHLLADGVICDTDSIGHEQPGGRSSTELVLDSPDGFIPLWAPNSMLNWRFEERAFSAFARPESAKAYIRDLMAAAIQAWGPFVPVRFKERSHGVDFEITVSRTEKCTPRGCVLASAFFPDSGQHNLVLYPTLFDQDRKEQEETMAHEMGHIFGLRHFFAKVKESARASTLFGEQNAFTIMNYGAKSVLTDADRRDLARLYQEVWSGARIDINGTPVQQVVPFSTLHHQTEGRVTHQST